MTPRLDLVVGCNGAGKSTLVERHLQPLLHVPFVKADLIARQRWPDSAEAHSYDAARLAAATRDTLIERGTRSSPRRSSRTPRNWSSSNVRTPPDTESRCTS